MTKKFIEKNYDEFVRFYYNSPCSGCPEGHASFWKSIIESEEWEKWKKVGQRDFSECEELGICSSDHWKEFVEFIKTL